VACGGGALKGSIAAATATRLWRNDAPGGWRCVPVTAFSLGWSLN
jgi:hypothetical protein